MDQVLPSDAAATDGGERPSTPDVAARLAALRRQRRWTLQQTSRQTGLSVSALSKIERSELSPTLASLRKLAKGFGIDVVTLLTGVEGQASSGRRSINRHPDGAPHRTATCLNLWLAADLRQKKMLPIRSRVFARRAEDYADWAVHSGEIFVYVLKGTLIVHSELYAPLRLATGDSLYYDASTRHIWLSEGDEDAEVLWLHAA